MVFALFGSFFHFSPLLAKPFEIGFWKMPCTVCSERESLISQFGHLSSVAAYHLFSLFSLLPLVILHKRMLPGMVNAFEKPDDFIPDEPATFSIPPEPVPPPKTMLEQLWEEEPFPDIVSLFFVKVHRNSPFSAGSRAGRGRVFRKGGRPPGGSPPAVCQSRRVHQAIPRGTALRGHHHSLLPCWRGWHTHLLHQTR